MYDAALFLHITGVVMLVVGISYALGGFALATRARTAGDVHRALTMVPLAERIFPVAMLVIPVTGLYMASRHGGDGSIAWNNTWLDLAIGIFAVMLVLGPGVESKRVVALRDAAAELAPEAGIDSEVCADLRRRLGDPVLSHVGAFGACQVGAFLWLMTNKPATAPAILTVSIAAVVSIGVGRALLAGSRTTDGADAVVPAELTDPVEALSAT